MISSGGSMIDTARDVKERGANRVFIFATFGLFTNGMKKFDDAYEQGLFTRVCCTNLTYQDPELLKRDYFINVDMSKYMSYIIDSLNHDVSISDLLDPSAKIKSLIQRYNNGELSNEDIDKLE